MQKETLFVFARPHGFTRVMSKVPTWLYRRGWGGLFGHRLLMITHIGRKSGRIYDTVLDVIRYDPRTRESVVISAYGERADWLRNIQARPPLAVQVGREKYVPTWRVLSPEENDREFPAYRSAHPLWVGVRMRWFSRVLGLPYERTPQAQRAIIERLCLVSFRPQEEPPLT